MEGVKGLLKSRRITWSSTRGEEGLKAWMALAKLKEKYDKIGLKLAFGPEGPFKKGPLKYAGLRQRLLGLDTVA